MSFYFLPCLLFSPTAFLSVYIHRIPRSYSPPFFSLFPTSSSLSYSLPYNGLPYSISSPLLSSYRVTTSFHLCNPNSRSLVVFFYLLSLSSHPLFLIPPPFFLIPL